MNEPAYRETNCYRTGKQITIDRENRHREREGGRWRSYLAWAIAGPKIIIITTASAQISPALHQIRFLILPPPLLMVASQRKKDWKELIGGERC
jgi:hypothetical protein